MEMKICPTCGTEYEPKERFCPRDGTALRTQGGASDLVGQIIADRYHVLRKLGEGGMGQVYLAEHVKMGRKSAVKVMHPGMVHDPDAISRFNREAANASRINHPHVAAIYDFGETPDGLIYLAMEFVEGEPLTKLIERQGALVAARAAEVVRQAADALGAAHDMGIVHRDLKPDNVMVGRGRDGADLVKVVDFGIAKAGAEASQKVTRTGLVVGTPEYMSPEQLAGDKLDGRSDLYSLALVAFNMLTGTLPFPSETAQESMIMRLTDRPRTLAEMKPDVAWPEALQRVMDRALERDARARYQGATEFARDLVRAVDGMPASHAADAGTMVLGAPSLPPTRVGGAGGGAGGTAMATIAAPLNSYSPTVAAPAPGRMAGAPTAPAAPARKRSPALLAAAVVGVLAIGGGAAFALRGNPAAAPAVSGDSLALAGREVAAAPAAPATATPDASQGAATPANVPAPGVQQYANPTTTAPAALDAAKSSTTTSAPVTTAAAEPDESTVAAQIDAASGGRTMTETQARETVRLYERYGARLRSPQRRLQARARYGEALMTLERSAEGCRELNGVRTSPAFTLMTEGFQQGISAYFTDTPDFDAPCK